VTKSFRTNRRTVLRGLGGVALSLPFLELFMPKAANAAPAPLRYVIAFGGSSLGLQSRNFVTPANTGTLVGNLSRGLQPLADYSVADVTSWVSGLTIPWGASPPAGGRNIKWHCSSPCPLLCGVRSGQNENLTGPTSDWLVAETIGGHTLQTRPVLSYRVQAAYYRGGNGTTSARGRMSARMNNGSLEQVDPTFSPKLAFDDLFVGFTPSDPEGAAQAENLLSRRKSVIDLVRGDTEGLLSRLGAADKLRMERHFDELRALENKLNALAPPGTASCQELADPGDDPPVGAALDVDNKEAGLSQNDAWSNEELRAEVMVDLVHMALACDLSRVASLMFTYAQCFMNVNPLFGYVSDLHQLGHFGAGGGDEGANAVADGVAWHVKHTARLMRKLRDSTDFDGNTLLDNTAVVLMFEGGVGFDPEQNNEGTAHSSENMGVLVGGLAGGLNKSGGQHHKTNGAHPVRVLNTVMEALGATNNLGEVTGTLPTLLA
jgi:uncharacterized protein DUF1552